MNDDEWIYQEDDFNEDLPFVELQFGLDDLYILYECVKYRYEEMAWQVVIQMNKKDLNI